MKIEVWLDFVCPFCYIGEKKLNMALKELNLGDKAEISYKSFQLNVNAKREPGKDLHQLIADKYGISYAQAKAANDNLINVAKEVGLNFDFENIKPGNTGLAHQLYKYAVTLNKAEEVGTLLFKAYFEEGIDISDRSELYKLADQAGISQDDLSEIFDSERFGEAVMNDQDKAFKMGISGVPFFIINDKHTISGAQSIEHFKSVLSSSSQE